MPSILNLKFKVGRLAFFRLPFLTHPIGFRAHHSQGNKSFVAFSNLADTDSLTSTWKVRGIQSLLFITS